MLLQKGDMFTLRLYFQMLTLQPEDTENLLFRLHLKIAKYCLKLVACQNKCLKSL